MYSSLSAGVKRAVFAALLPPIFALGMQTDEPRCDAGLVRLWTPRIPQLGRYEVCTTDRALTEVADPWWRIEPMAPLDAFGDAGSYSKATVARLYGGRRPMVAHGWVEENGRVVSITLVSPYPNRELRTLEAGTLIIRYFVFD